MTPEPPASPHHRPPWWQYLDARPWWHPLRWINVGGVRFNESAYQARHWGRWHARAYCCDGVFRAKGRTLQLRKLPLGRFGWTQTLWTLRPDDAVAEVVTRLAHTANRTRRRAARRLNASVADPPWCFDCGYDRTGLPPGNACPECGWRPAPGGVYLFPRGGGQSRSFLIEWRQLMAVLLLLAPLIVLLAVGPPGFWPLPKIAWSWFVIAAGAGAGFLFERAFGDRHKPPTLGRQTLRLEPGDDRPLRLRSPGAFDTTLAPRRVRRLRVDRVWPNLYRLRRPPRWWRFGVRFEVYFEASPKQAARVRAALARV